MATQQIDNEPDVGMSSLVGGIVQDARELIVQQLTLFQVEIKHDVQRTLSAFMPLAAGVGVCLAGLFLLGMAGAHLLLSLFPDLPVWGAYGFAGAAVILSGVLLMLWGKTMLPTSATPDTALKALKENLQWKTKS